MTSNLIQRMNQHKTHAAPGFSEKYGTHLLVWYECHDSVETAIVREKQIKKWNRPWKIRLIEDKNPAWGDLSTNLA